jgi:hypothetical protein
MVFVGTHHGWPIRTFAIVNVALAVGWIAFGVLIGKEDRRRAAARDAQPATPAATRVDDAA